MRVIAEFVDKRNGKRYFPGEGSIIEPPLDDAQVKHLTKASCLAEGTDDPSQIKPRPTAGTDNSNPTSRAIAEALNAQADRHAVELKTLTADRDAHKARVAELEAQVEHLTSPGGANGGGRPAADEPVDLSQKSKADLSALALERGVDISDCATKADIIAKLAGEKK